jgi:hypothetical protein
MNDELGTHSRSSFSFIIHHSLPVMAPAALSLRGKSTTNVIMEQGDAELIVREMLEGLDGERALVGLIGLLLRDHLRMRAEKRSTAINLPTVLWQVERAIAERLRARGPGGLGARGGGGAGSAGGASGTGAEEDETILGTLAVLLVQCRERAEDQAGPPEDEPPRMRIVRD